MTPTSADNARGDSPFQIVLRKEGGYRSGVGVGFAIEEPHFLAVRQEDERHPKLSGAGACLVVRRDGIDARAFGFEHRHRATLPAS